MSTTKPDTHRRYMRVAYQNGRINHIYTVGEQAFQGAWAHYTTWPGIESVEEITKQEWENAREANDNDTNP